MPGVNDTVNPGGEQHAGVQGGAGERVLPPTRVLLPAPPPDQVTPHRLATILLILEYIEYRHTHLLLPYERSQFCILLLNLIQWPEQSLSRLVDKVLSVSPPPQFLKLWAERIGKVQEEGVAGTMDIFHHVDRLFYDNIVTVQKSSVVGLLLRRVSLQFHKLTFSEVSSLQIKFTTFYTRGKEALKKLLGYENYTELNNHTDSDLEMSLEATDFQYRLPLALPPEYQPKDPSIRDEEDEEEDCQYISRKQADFLIARQAGLLQHAESAALSPISLQKELSVILKFNPGLQEAHFLSFLNCLRLNEVVGAMDSLYASSNQSINPSTLKASLEDLKTGFRYADLNLAMLHHRLGHNKEALAAVRESITIGQDARDHVCLQHALCWVARFSQGNTIPLMIRCVTKCQQLGLYYLASLGMLLLCSMVEELGQRPSYIFDMLTKSSVFNCKNNLVDLQANCLLTRASVWNSFGRPQMAGLVSQILLQLNTADPNREGLFYQGEPIAMAFANIALQLDSEGYSSEADSVLMRADRLFPSPSSQFSHIWRIAKNQIIFSRATRSGNWAQAESAVSLLSCHLPSCQYLKAELLFQQGNFPEARALLQDIIHKADGLAKCDEEGSEKPRKEVLVKCLLLLSNLHCLSNDPGGAVTHLIRAVDTAEHHKMDLLRALACLHLANAHLMLGCAERALKLSRQCLAFLLSHATKTDRSRGWLLAAKCRVAVAANLPLVERRAELLEGAKEVGTAKEGFADMSDWSRMKDCLYLQARIYHALQLPQERNMAAQQYKKFDSLYPTVISTHQLLLI